MWFFGSWMLSLFLLPFALVANGALQSILMVIVIGCLCMPFVVAISLTAMNESDGDVHYD